MDQTHRNGTSRCDMTEDSEAEDDCYLSQLCRGNTNNSNSDEQQHGDHADSNGTCHTPSKIPKQSDNFESSLEQHVFNRNMLSTSSPKTDHSIDLTDENSNASSTVTVQSVGNDHKDVIDEASRDDMDIQHQEKHHTSEAEEIVKKLCKNGKIMQFQESEDFIKVIVYEDSQESNDLDDTLSAEESENTGSNNEKKSLGQCKTKNLLECLTENSTSVTSTMRSFEEPNHSPVQPYPVTSHYPSSVNSQSHFIHQGHQSLPISYNGPGEYNFIHPDNLMNHCNNAVVPLALHPSQHLATHHGGGFMFYRQNEGHNAPKLQASEATQGHKSKAVNTGHMATTALQLNSSGEEHTSPNEFKQTPSSGRKAQSKVRTLMQPPPFPGDDWGKIREQHNQKERRRRARIKEACNLLRQLVPGMSDKTDKATVFEFAARYVHFLKSHTGTQFDKDFLMKYSPY